MNCLQALDILEIEHVNCEMSFENLKKQYRKMALKHHPDKNGNTFESKNRFQQINEAFTCLKRNMNDCAKHENEDNDEDKDNDEDEDNANDKRNYLFNYVDLLKKFIESMFHGKYNQLISKIIHEISATSKTISEKIFDDLDKDTALNIYSFLSSNRSILHIHGDILQQIREIVVNKYSNVEVYKLNPSLDDLLNNNLYKLFLHNNLFLVPLWHYESCFDHNGVEIIVICEPELDDNVSIDDENNICFEHRISFHDLHDIVMQNISIKIVVGETIYFIDPSLLFLKKEQLFRFKNKGLSKIKKDVYDVSEKSDIVVKIVIC
jgi:DnaJ-class molecular chaperone